MIVGILLFGVDEMLDLGSLVLVVGGAILGTLWLVHAKNPIVSIIGLSVFLGWVGHRLWTHVGGMTGLRAFWHARPISAWLYATLATTLLAVCIS